MAGRVKFLLLYYIAWILFFECARLLFLLYHFSQAGHFSTMLLSFWYGLRMDASMSAYILLPVCLMVIASLFLPFFRRALIYKIYTCLALFFMLFIILVDLEIYTSWGFRIDVTPLRYLSSPREVWASVSHLPVFLILFVFFLVYIGICFLFNRLIRKLIPGVQAVSKKILQAFVFLFFAALLIIPIRGGVQLIPLNQSSVYFSRDNFANVTALNAPWNFLHGLIHEPSSSKNPYAYLNEQKAKRIVDSLYAASDSNQLVLKNRQPNVILIVWESFTEKATHVRMEGKEVTPGFNALKKEGIYFSNLYASGDRTDKGLAAVLSGYPALNKFSVIHMPGKSAKLKTLGSFFKELGYQTSFYYGGEPEFANIKSYVLQGKFDQLIDKNDFSSKDLNSKWGAHDGVVAEKILTDIQKTRAPFFTTWLTLSSHEPFETPTKPAFSLNSVTDKFLNSLHYTDEVIYQMVQQCKQQSWWSNTLMIIIADHGHMLPEPTNTLDNAKIPMLWLGGALNQTAITIDKTVSQIDLATTISKQIKPDSKFAFSKNIFDSSIKQWAYFSFNWGFGFAQPGKAFVFDNVGKQIVQKKGAITEKDIEAGKAMQQVIYGDYLKK